MQSLVSNHEDFLRQRIRKRKRKPITNKKQFNKASTMNLAALLSPSIPTLQRSSSTTSSSATSSSASTCFSINASSINSASSRLTIESDNVKGEPTMENLMYNLAVSFSNLLKCCKPFDSPLQLLTHRIDFQYKSLNQSSSNRSFYSIAKDHMKNRIKLHSITKQDKIQLDNHEAKVCIFCYGTILYYHGSKSTINRLKVKQDAPVKEKKIRAAHKLEMTRSLLRHHCLGGDMLPHKEVIQLSERSISELTKNLNDLNPNF